MKIAPVFLSNNKVKHNNNGQNFSSVNFNNSINKPCCDDIFIRLADASMRDKKIESELKSMGLI